MAPFCNLFIERPSYMGWGVFHCVCTNASRGLSATAEFLVLRNLVKRKQKQIKMATLAAGYVARFVRKVNCGGELQKRVYYTTISCDLSSASER